MVRFIFLISVFILLLHSKAYAQTTTGSIFVMGDSLAYGTGAGGDALNATNCLSQVFPNQVINKAVPGAKTEDLLKVMAQEFQGDIPQMVFVSIGGNDAIGNLKSPGSYPEAKTLQEVEQVFSEFEKRGVVVLYLSLDPPYPGANRLLKITKMAQQKNFITVDGMNGIWGQSQLMSNLFHPNKKGYAMMCDKILQAVQEYVP